ncbi:MAG TPA: pantoate--beta-alanine ligase [Ferruginibacter sp.]|nr:pantoate--beta-alanine ligase [Ferruginibacter sp.]
MILVKHITDLKNIISSYKAKGFKIGFVPTMGALHPGHISLIKAGKEANHVTVCSIFVNPTQFNNPVDFNKYPITIEKDIAMLEEAGCEILFLPSVAEMYPPNDPVLIYELGYLETLLEGKYRPGHFQGVCRIVDKLLNAVVPDTLYLGQKDFQQCLVIKKMIALKNHPANVEIIETMREWDGLAMSSRNLRLDEAARKKAVLIIESLRKIKDTIKEADVNSICSQAIERLNQQGFKVDYVQIANATDLQPLTVWDGQQKAVVLIAAFIGEVRLIDNLLLN